ncbi:MAG: pilus assembly protein TadG-related protein [Coriobacteriia bacterium]|nr:pilus assembly protein TadG-related protein [Coriobacteriia bacterium]
MSVRTRMRDDAGASATIVAITLSLLLIIAAFAVDVGYAYAVRRQLQSAADAAALAGCRELIAGASDARVLEVAADYASRNATEPADGLTMRTQPPDTVVGPDFVQVTVEKRASAFFSRIMGRQDIPVTATARAKVAYLTGLRGVVPWSVPVIHASRVAVKVAGGTEIALSDQGGGVWRGVIPVPTAPQTTGYRVDVIAYNDQTAYPDGTSEYPNGVPETVEGAARVLVLPATAPVTDVSLDRCVAVSGSGSVTLTVRTTGTGKNYEPSVRFDGKSNWKFTEVSPGVWRTALPVPAIEKTHKVYAIEKIEVANKTVATDALALVVRRPTYPIADVALDDYTNPGGAVQVTVTLLDYQYGVQYPLKVVGGGAEVGNFCALDLATIKHPPNWRNPQHPSEYDLRTDPQFKTPAYYCYLEKPFPFVIHIGDTIWTETGNLSGPQTASALDKRFAGDSLTFAQWEALGRPPTRRIVYVPVVEKMQLVSGQTPMRVVSFAAFFIEPGSDLKKDVIIGRFIEYASPSDAVSDTPPDGLYVETVRLVTPE